MPPPHEYVGMNFRYEPTSKKVCTSLRRSYCYLVNSGESNDDTTAEIQSFPQKTIKVGYLRDNMQLLPYLVVKDTRASCWTEHSLVYLHRNRRASLHVVRGGYRTGKEAIQTHTGFKHLPAYCE